MRRAAFVVATLLVATVGASIATPPRPGTEPENNLTENESATLWSGDNDSGYINNSVYREAYGENRTIVHQIANGTDLTFKRPPATASIWTRNDFGDVPVGNDSVSIHPPDANLTNSTVIADAHASIFAVQPATVVHESPGTTRQYLAPDGTLFGQVDYRVRTQPAVADERNVSVEVLDHEVTEVRVLVDGRVVNRTNGSQTPQVDYELDGEDVTVTLEADIEATVRQTVSVGGIVQNETVVQDAVTVNDSLAGRVYDLSASGYVTRYPDGDHGVAVFVSGPWQGYSMTRDGSPRVRGVWRFYTARDTDWDVLVTSTATNTSRAASPALPVAVHAYPSAIGPRIEPPGNGTERLAIWGPEREAPTGTIGEHVAVEVVETPYRQSWGYAVRTDNFDRESFAVRGIVRGVNATITDVSERRVRESSLAATVVRANESGALVRLQVTDAATGEPIRVAADERPRFVPIRDRDDQGYVSIAGQRVSTGANGTATVWVSDPGVYTARYHPASWLDVDPAYVSSTASARWHPLTTMAGWLTLGVGALQLALPFALALYAGRRLGSMFRYGDRYP